MRAIVQDEYGPPDVLRLGEVPRPVPGSGEVLVRVEAAAIHAGDWMLLLGRPYTVIRPVYGLRRPKKKIPGYDVAGVVEGVGDEVTGVVVGDEVFGKSSSGSCAEFAVADADVLAPKPAPIDFEQAAALPISGSAALHGIRDAAGVQAGKHILINGASGGVGTFAVQISKALGAEVTAVCSAKNAALMRSIGADHVVDYASADFTTGGPRYDVIFDNVGNHSLRELRRAVASGGTSIPNNGTAGGPWFGTIGRFVRAGLGSMVISKQGRPFASTERKEDLLDLAAMVEAGDVTPVIGARYPLQQAAEAFALVGSGHAVGKTVITT